MIAGHLKLSTPYFGLQRIDWFAETKSNERFLAYCWDSNDFTLGWVYNINKIDISKTIRIKLENGTSFISTLDHLVLMSSKEWRKASDLKFGDHLLAFNKVKPNIHFNGNLKRKQFPRIYTHRDGWKHERQFIDEWRTGKVEENDKYQYMVNRLLTEGTTVKETCRIIKHDKEVLRARLKREGYSLKELRVLGKIKDYRRIIGIEPWLDMNVYDLSIETHKTFCSESVVLRAN